LSNLSRTTENFNCTGLLHTFPETDLRLLFCEPNAAGESPGDKYGYLDFDLAYGPNNTIDAAASRTRQQVGDPIYSSWHNHVDNLGTNHMIYSTGVIYSTTSEMWATPSPLDNTRADLGQCDVGGAAELPVAIDGDMYTNPGASGSGLISGATGRARRLISGPISIGRAESRGRWTLPIIEYLTRAVAPFPTTRPCGSTTVDPNLNGTFIQQRWGLNAADFRGILDTNINGVFDIQERLERVRGENNRETYWFGFESPRHNQQWDANGTWTITGIGITNLSADAAGWLRHAWNPRMHLVANANYHVSYAVNSDRTHRVCLGSNCTDIAAATGSFIPGATVLNSGAGNELSLWTFGNGTTSHREVVVVRMGTSARFDSADARALWTTPVSRWGSSTPNFLSLGRNSSTGADYTAMVGRGLWTLESLHQPFSAGRNRVCFDARNNPLETTNTGNWRIRVGEGTTQHVNTTIAATSSWTRSCTPYFTLGGASAVIQFGLEQGSAASPSAPGSFLVDNITIEK
jgi:hypothetical protein